MKKLLAASAALSLIGTSVFAGGPVVISEEPAPVVITENTSSSKSAWIPLAIGAVAIAAALSGGDGT